MSVNTSNVTLGGPIQRNTLFFFGDYQHTLDNAGRTTRAAIPPLAFRNGDFSPKAPGVARTSFLGVGRWELGVGRASGRAFSGRRASWFQPLNARNKRAVVWKEARRR